MGEGWSEDQGLSKVVGINHPLVLSLSKDGRRWFDKLTMSGMLRFVIASASVAISMRRRSGGIRMILRRAQDERGGGARDCHVARQAHHERLRSS